MTELLAHGTVVLDGGLSNALEDRGHDLSSDLWTARLLRDDPGEIVAVHRAYFAAGARVATTASYQASVPGLVAAGLSRREAERLIASSVRLAREARDEAAAHAEAPLFVAASVGPYGAALADGSEYTGRYGRTAAQLRDFHGPRLELLAAAGPDLLAVETIPDADEAEVLRAAARRDRDAGVVQLLRGGRHDPGGPATRVGVRSPPGQYDDPRRRRELLGPRRRPRRRADRGRGHRPAGGGLPEPRRGLGQRLAHVGRVGHLRPPRGP